MVPIFLDIEQVLELHRSMIEQYGGAYGVRDLGLLQSAVITPQASFGGEYLHRDIFEMAAGLPRHHARPASRCWLGSPGWARSTESQRRLQRLISFAPSFPGCLARAPFTVSFVPILRNMQVRSSRPAYPSREVRPASVCRAALLGLYPDVNEKRQTGLA